MALKRKQIRQAAVDALLNQTDAAVNVFASRATPLWDIPLPAILIYARSESSELLASGMPTLLRNMSLAIEIRAMANSDIDDVLDDIAVQVETAIIAAGDFNGLTISCILQGTEIEVAQVGEDPIGAARLTYEIRYQE